jgi:hypothetical protein
LAVPWSWTAFKTVHVQVLQWGRDHFFWQGHKEMAGLRIGSCLYPHPDSDEKLGRFAGGIDQLGLVIGEWILAISQINK